MDASVAIGEHMTMKSSTAYAAPEYVVDRANLIAAFSVDVWSFGALAFELCTGRALIAKNLYDNAQQSGLAELRGWKGFHEGLRDLIFQFMPERAGSAMVRHAEDLLRRCLSPETTKRPSMLDVLTHPFLVPSTVRSTAQVPPPTPGSGPGCELDSTECVRL